MRSDFRTTVERIVRTELRALVDAGHLRDARIHVGCAAGCRRCRISAHRSDGSPIVAEAVGATRTRAVRMAVQRLRDLVFDHGATAHSTRKERAHDSHDITFKRRADLRSLRRRRRGRGVRAVSSGWAIVA